MASKRMFSLTVADTDLFLDMPSSSQALYFHLGLRADDDGFVASPKKIAKICGCGDDDLRILVSKRFILPFESGIVVLTHWHLNNNRIKTDRYKPTLYKDEKAMLSLENGMYFFSGSNLETSWNQSGNNVEPQNRLDEKRLDEKRRGNNGGKSSRFIPPTVEEVSEYCRERGNNVDAQCFVDFYSSKGWYVGKSKMKDWKASVRTWERKERSNNQSRTTEEVLEFLTSVMRGNIAEQFGLDPAIADRTKAAQLLMKRFNDDQRMNMELTKLEIRFKESMPEVHERDNFLDALNITANEVWNN